MRMLTKYLNVNNVDEAAARFSLFSAVYGFRLIIKL